MKSTCLSVSELSDAACNIVILCNEENVINRKVVVYLAKSALSEL